MSAILRLTDGTTTINLLSETSGFHLVNWEPAIAEYKEGGLWRDTPFATGRRLTGKFYANTTETMTLTLNGENADNAAYHLQEIRRLLDKAADYWVGKWTTEPVWVEAQAPGETRMRYALLAMGRVGQDRNPYAVPFLQPKCEAVMAELPLTFERGHWLSSRPGTRECALPYLPVRKTFGLSEGADDAYVQKGGTITTGGTTVIAGDVGGDFRHAGFRFRNVAIPPGAFILSAHLCFEVASTLSTTCNLTVRGERNASPAAFSTYTDFMSRTLTETERSWDAVAGLTANDDANSPDVAQVVQEIIDLPTWKSGNNLAIFLYNNASASGGRRAFAAYEHASQHAPYLVVTWMDEAATCTDVDYARQFMVLSKRNRAQLTGIYFYNNTSTTWDENALETGTFPYTLGASVEINDALYFVSDTLAPDSGPFDNLFFDLASDNGSTAAYVWEVWTGAAWVSLAETDFTSALAGTGRKTVHWYPNASWATFDLGSIGGTNNPGVTGYVVRARVDALVLSAGVKLNNHPYTVIWPYVEFPASSIPGDLPALAAWEVRNWFNADWNFAELGWIMLAVRSYARGPQFESFLNFSDVQNPTGITVAAGASSAFASDIAVSTGRYIAVNDAGSLSLARVSITLDASIAQDYIGRYRAFILLKSSFSVGPVISYFLKVEIGDTIFYTDTHYFEAGFRTLDVGIFDLNTYVAAGELINSLKFTLFTQRESGSGVFNLESLVLMPIDEYSAQFSANDLVLGAAPDGNYLDADSLRFPKSRVRGVSRDGVTDAFDGAYMASAPDALIMQANARQRVFLLAQTNDDSTSHRSNALSVAPYKVSQYFSLRGSR